MKTKVQQFAEGVGVRKFWGFSPAIDLLTLPHASTPSQAPLDMLCVAPGDITSVLLTMSRLGRHPKRDKVCIHVMEERPECHARHLLLLSIFLDTDLGPRERTEMFLEVYGNSQIRKQTSAYIQSKVQTLVRFLTDTEGGEVEKQLSRLVDVSHLKSKQRDEIEKVILSWSEGVETGMGEWREKRMRNYYEDRYDYRKNLYDWDYNFHFKDLASVIHKKLFMQWRDEGIAFEIRESKYPEPNRTMASYAEGKEKGFSKLRRGFWSDIVQSPYWALGVCAEDERLFKIRSMQHTKTCQHVCEYNMYAMLHELATGEKYEMADEQADNYGRSFWGGLQTDSLTIHEEDDEEDLTRDRLDTMALKEGKRGSTGPSLDGFKIVLLQGAGVQALEGKKKYESAYDVVVVSNLVAHTLKREYGCQSILKKPHSVVVCEGADYMLNLDKEEKKGFADKIAEFGRGLGCHIEAGKERVPGGTHLGVPLPLYRLVYDDEKAGKIVDEWAEEERVKKEKEEKEGGKRRGKSDGEVEGGALGEVLGDKAVEQVGGGDDDGEIIEVKATSKNGSSEKADAKPPPGPCGYCTVSGKPAKYRDPLTGEPYADAAAFKELRARHAEAHPESVKEEVVSPEADKQGVEGKGEGEGEEQQQQQQEEEEEEEEEVPLFMQKKKTWGLGGAAVS